VFLRNDNFDQTGGAAVLSLDRALVPVTDLSFTEKTRAAIARIDWTPDLGARIGSLEWFRGAATCAALLAATWALSPGFARPVIGATPAALKGIAWDNARAQAIAPLAWGADTGQRLAANDLVRPLTETPERPTLEINAALGEGDSLASLLQRSGVSRTDASAAAGLIANAVSLDEIKPGTRIDMVLGRRTSKSVPRPLEKLGFRASFDLFLNLNRAGSNLSMQRQTIAVDDTPLRIQGLAGKSLYKSMRAAGVPSTVAADYLKAMASRISLGGDVSPGDTWDVVLGQRRAATGEVELGAIELAGLDLGRRKVQLVKWRGEDDDGNGQWFDANGQTQRQGFMGLPVAGRISSSFGMRMHPILGYYRMHKGMDIACPYGSPVYAVIDGVVNWAGGKSGYGNFVGIQGPGGVGTGYGHLSRVLVRSGQRVERGQVVAYSGNSGLSTGPHLHFEVYRGGAAVNPRGFSFSNIATLTGNALRAFKSKVAELLAVHPGTAR
jgi:murein DD-endopeptidase MepM/ murein hydrolase activator NlpD